MHNKYLSALKTTYANFGLSKEALDRVASQRFKTIANEDEIDADVKSFDTLMLLMKEQQGTTDALRAAHAKTQKELAELKISQAPTPTEPTQPTEPNSELTELKAMINQLVAENAESKKKARYDATIKAVQAKMKESGCDNEAICNMTLKGVQFADTDTVEALAEKFKAEYNANCKMIFGDGYVPPKSNNTSGNEIDYSAMVAGLKASGDL